MSTVLATGAVMWAFIASVMFVVMAGRAARVRQRAVRLQERAAAVGNHWERLAGGKCDGEERREMDDLVLLMVSAAIDVSEEEP